MHQKRIGFLLLLLLSVLAKGQGMEWKGAAAYQNITSDVSFLQDTNGALTIDEVSAAGFQSRFTPSNKIILNFGMTSGVAYWLKFTINNTSGKPLYLELSQFHLSKADLYYLDKDGRWQVNRAGNTVPIYNKHIKHHLPVFELPASPGSRTYFVRFMHLSFPTVVKLWDKEAFEVNNAIQNIYFGIYAGILLFVILINIFLSVTLRSLLNLHYAVVVFLYLMNAALLLDGYALYLFPDIDVNFWAFYVGPVSFANTTLYTVFFLDVKRYAPRQYRWSMLFFWYFLSYLVWQFWLSHYVLQVFASLHALVVLCICWYLGWRTGRNGNRIGYYFALAYFIYFGIVILEFAYIQTGKPAYFLNFTHVSVAAFLEVLILALLLFVRFSWEKFDMEKAKLAAQQEALERTRENERLVREQNIILEEKVMQRTEELRVANEELNATLQIVEQERQKSDDLLLNILPVATAQELKEKGHASPNVYNSVTVLFTDFQNFSESTRQISPENLVNTLNHCFSAFDEIIQKYGLEKIKTIGDAYMAVGGLPAPNETHAVDAVNAAIDMVDFIEDWKTKQRANGQVAWDMRIGLHTGQVISGVVGIHKFSFDIWGDTVNTASRLEALGSPGRINISADTYALVKDHFRCTHRGTMAVKGKGEMELYWVER